MNKPGSVVRFRLDSSPRISEDEEKGDTMSKAKVYPSKPADIEYYYSKDGGCHLAVNTSKGTFGKSKANSMTPIAEVAPRTSTDDDEIEAWENVFPLATSTRKPESKSTSRRHGPIERAGKSGSQGSVQSRLSTAEIFVALSEKRRSMAIAETDAVKRLGATATKRTSVAPEPVDLLRANMQMLYECCHLLKRNQRHVMFNIFLILLVALILSSMIVFAFLAPTKSEFDLVLAPWVTFWPLDMRLRLYQLGNSKDSLTLTLGNSNIPFTNKAPSYCNCCVDDAPKCHKDLERCWCFQWRTQARLYVAAVKPMDTQADCLILEWRSTSPQRVQVTDCVRTSFNDGVRWYGGPLTIGQKWPMNINVTNSTFQPYLVNDVQSEPGGMSGVAEPLWISDNGFAIMASLDNPFLVNLSDSSVCLQSNDVTVSPLRYMVCRAEDSRTYTLNVSTLNQYVTWSYPQSTDIPDSVPHPDIIGAIFVNYDSPDVDLAELIAVENKTTTLKYEGLGIMFQNFDLLNDTMALHLIDSIERAEDALGYAKGGGPLIGVEVNNFARFYHMEGVEGQEMQQRCIKQSQKNTIGVSKWRDNIYGALDFGRPDISDWFVSLCSNHVINNVTTYLAFAGGDANSLPVLPNLNVSNSQINFYSTLYSLTASSIPKSVLIDVAYNTHGVTSLYVTLAVSSDDVHSMIPLILTTSLQGYSRLALNLVNYTFPGDGWRPMPESSDPLFTWIQIAMFTPVFRIPKDVLNWHGFSFVMERFKPFREQIVLTHYARAADTNLLTGEPIFKPIWWMDYKDYRQGKYSADEAQVWANDRQFMLGDDLMVAVFLSESGTTMQVYFPPGRWRNVEAQTTIDGGKFVYYVAKFNVECFERVLHKQVESDKTVIVPSAIGGDV